MTFKTIVIMAFIFIFSSHTFVFAAERPGENVGAQAERFLKDVEKKKGEREKKKIQAPQIEIQEEAEKAKPQAEEASFTLEEVRIAGVTVFKLMDFFPIYQPYLHKKVTFSDLESITEKIKAKYKEKGYLTTTVYIPEQEIAEGKIEIRVFEGKMGNLNSEGNRWFSLSLLKRYFHTKKDEILNVNKLQKDILRLNQNPDLEVKAVIAPGKTSGTSDVILKVREKFPFHAGAGFDNQGTRLVGKYRQLVLLRSSNATGNLDALYMATLLSSNSFGESVSYLTPLNTYGLRFRLDSTYFKMKLGKEYGVFDITGNTQIYSPRLLCELYLSENFQVGADCGMEIKYIKKKMGGNISTNDNLRLPFFGFNFTKNDSFKGRQITYAPRFIFGIEDFLGASERGHPSASREGTGGRFFKTEQSLEYTQRMIFDSYILLRSQVQISSLSLASSEQFQLGGANSVRGYPEGDYLADLGGSFNLDWVFPMYLIPRAWKLPYQNIELRRQIEPIFFIDAGGGKLKTVLGGEKREKFLSGAGGGIRINFGRIFSLALYWAQHLGDEPTQGSGPSNFHLTFQSEI